MRERFSNFLVTGLILVLAVITASCLTAPTFPTTPEISFNSITFQKGESALDGDTLALTVNFQDGDGDLGLRPNVDVGEPYNSIYFFLKPNAEFLKLSDRNDPLYDTLPPYEFPYYCTNYVIEEVASTGETDTFYVQQNEFHNNILVKFFVKKNGVYDEFNWVTEFDPICGESFNGRYPLLGIIGREKPLEGKLKYKMSSAGFEFLFRQDTLKLEVYIYDRALNKSNVIETPDFVLKDITLGG